jgi:hypothetical protein
MPPHVTIPAGFAIASLYVPTLSNPQRDGSRTIGVRLMPPPEHDVNAWLKPAAAATTTATRPAATQPAAGN